MLKKLIILTLAIALPIQAYTPQGKHSGLQQYLHGLSQNIKSLSPSTINNNGTLALSSGSYILTDHCNFYPLQLWQSSNNMQNWQNQTTPRCILYITKNDTVIDLNEKTLTMLNPTGSPFLQTGIVGIYIAPGVQNVTIKNGTIDHMSGAGICIDKNCQNIIIENVAITHAGLAGIIVGYNPFSDKYSSVFQAQLEIADLNPIVPLNEAEQPVYPETITTNNIIIRNCTINNTHGYYYTDENDIETWTMSNPIGIDIVDTLQVQISNSVSNNNQYSVDENIRTSTTHPARDYRPDKPGHISYGIRMIRCHNSSISNTQASHNQGWATYGFYLKNCSTIISDDCQAHKNIADGSHANYDALLGENFYYDSLHLGQAVGFCLADSSECTLNRCKADNNNGTRHTAGFWIRKEHIVCASSDAVIDPTCEVIHFQADIDLQTSCNETTIITSLTDLIIPNFSELLANPPAKGIGYTIPTSDMQIIIHNADNNSFNQCISSHNHSEFLDAYGFLCDAGNNNIFWQCQAYGNKAGNGYQNGIVNCGIVNFDQGLEVYSLMNEPRYINKYTNKIIAQAAGFCLRSLRLPLQAWNEEEKRYLPYHTQDSSDWVFLAASINNTYPTLHLLLYWPNNATCIQECVSKYNKGGGIGSGCGILLNGASNATITQNMLYANTASSSGTIVNDTPGIGAQGGHGFYDMSSHCTSLLTNNISYANQIIRPKIITTTNPITTGLANAIEGSNYTNYYTDSTQALPVAQATLGDFSTFINALSYMNYSFNDSNTSSPYTMLAKELYSPVPYVFIIPA